MRRSSVADDGVCLHGEEEAADDDDGAAAGVLFACAWWAPPPPAEDREDEDVGRMAAAVKTRWVQGNGRSMPRAGRGGRCGGLNRDRIRCVPCLLWFSHFRLPGWVGFCRSDFTLFLFALIAAISLSRGRAIAIRTFGERRWVGGSGSNPPKHQIKGLKTQWDDG